MKMINLTNRNTIKGPKWEKFQNGYARHSPIYAMYIHPQDSHILPNLHSLTWNKN
jgi:hypothetical protein